MIVLPTKIKLSARSKKVYSINKNQERNWHHRIYSALKKRYCEIVLEQVKNIPPIKTYPITITYTYYHDSKRKVDIDNVCGVVAKFFQDAIVSAGLLTGDDYTCINKSIFIWGGIKSTAQVEITIHHD